MPHPDLVAHYAKLSKAIMLFAMPPRGLEAAQ